MSYPREQQDLAELSGIDGRILQSELIVTRQRARVENLERAGKDSSLSKSVLRNFINVLAFQYAHRGRVLRQLRY
jgi:hypothetical protein